MNRQFRVSVTLGLGMLMAGFVGMLVLFQFREAPAEASTGSEERKLDVEITVLEPVRHRVFIEGFGTARAAVSVSVAPEVSGRLVYASPRLRVGEHVQEGEVLVRIDNQDYVSLIDEREALVGQVEAEIRRLKSLESTDRARVADLARSRDLARIQFERSKLLFAEHVGTQVDVDKSEQAYNDAADRLRQVQSVLDTYPMAVEEAEKRLNAARAALERARLDLARTEIAAPFSGRIDAVMSAASGTTAAGAPAIAAGHFAEAGRPLLILADDTTLEIPIKLDAREAHAWLLRSGGDGVSLEPVQCDVRWTEIGDGASWSGTLARLENYDPASRTLTAVVEVNSRGQDSSTFPLADGMFCSVLLPGTTLDSVFAIPQSAISVDGRVHVAVGGRLESRTVRVVRTEGSTAYVDEGLMAGDRLVTTRLVNPIDGSLLRVAANDSVYAE